jgi:hypothetical protein
MSFGNSKIRSTSVVPVIEALESREFLSATLVEIKIPTASTTTTKVTHTKTPKVITPKVKKAKPAKTPKTSTNGEEHTNIGYLAFQ